ncbi:hypothetical protein LMG23994_06636 [Cupriavidus pinatubonensis]|uniref:Uncharacterized protein n=1 Tax=Cupriavidus pinatubonensis TaxID=248026 RepID=A0ABM8Y355_9BURK|nr:hypothetical protein LMG23994_06636 [Cupriavidus pinatubonensis]
MHAKKIAELAAKEALHQDKENQLSQGEARLGDNRPLSDPVKLHGLPRIDCPLHPVRHLAGPVPVLPRGAGGSGRGGSKHPAAGSSSVVRSLRRQVVVGHLVLNPADRRRPLSFIVIVVVAALAAIFRVRVGRRPVLVGRLLVWCLAIGRYRVDGSAPRSRSRGRRNSVSSWRASTASTSARSARRCAAASSVCTASRSTDQLGREWGPGLCQPAARRLQFCPPRLQSGLVRGVRLPLGGQVRLVFRER